MIMANYYRIDLDDAKEFYNQGGADGEQVGILKDDFRWYRMPFSKVNENTVFLIRAAICRNVYQYLNKIL